MRSTTGVWTAISLRRALRGAPGIALRVALRIARRIAIVAAFGIAAVARDAPAADDTPLVGKPVVDSLGRAAAALAKRGRRAETDEIVDVLARLRVADSDAAAVRQAADRALKTAKVAPAPIPDAVKAVQKAAADLAAALPAAADDAARRAIAEQALRLDSSLRDAHAALGHVEHAGRWVPAEIVPCLERRRVVQDAVRRARRLEIPVTISASDVAVLELVTGRAGTAATSGGFSVHAVHFETERITRQLREVLRAVALAQWMRTGRLEAPETGSPLRLVYVSDKAVYEKAIQAAREAGDLGERDAGHAKGWSGFIASSYMLFRGEGEFLIPTHALYHALHRALYAGAAPVPQLQPAMDAGLLNWLHVGFLGVPMPGVGWVETTGGEGGGGRTSDTPIVTKEREEHLRFAKAGLAGSRAYMRWLARRGEDPAWSRSMTDEVGKVTGPDLVKSTLVTDYLIETGEWESLRERTAEAAFGKAAFEAALGPLADFEGRWKSWLLAEDPAPSLVERLGGAGADDGPTAAERAAMSYLDSLRARTSKDAPRPLGVDRELSKGCRAHALYLVKHPQQAAAWPDAHEEYPDREGFSPEGSRAGLASVIMPGTRRPEDAIDGWMATFYHRIPLLHPGLLRIGWGHEGGFGVLDCVNFVAPATTASHALWPPPNSRDVPLRFAPELPNPVEGEDQSRWGYPVTAQFFAYEPDPVVRLTLHRGARADAATLVPCHFSTPSAPTNVKLAPPGVYCLIPKATLQPSTTYTVSADGWPGSKTPYTWSFTTAAK